MAGKLGQVALVCGVVAVAVLVGRLTAGDAPPRGIVTEVEVVEVYDGDTVTVQPIVPQVRVRLLDCWAPEVRTRDADEKRRGYASRDHLRGILKPGDRVRLQVPTGNKLQQSLTFGRVLGRIWCDVDGDGKLDDVSEAQVAAGHATEVR